MARKEFLVVAIIILLQSCYANWGFGTPGFGTGFHSGYNLNGHGYGSGICAGARRQQQQQQITFPVQNHYNQYPTFNGFTNQGYYSDPAPIQTSFLQPLSNNVDYRHDIYTQRPTTTTTTTKAPELPCSHPKSREPPEVFDLKCLFPHETTQTSCSSRGNSSFPVGTTAMTSCKAPQYFNDNSDTILEICKDGVWHGNGVTLTCKSKPIIVPKPDPVVEYVKSPAASSLNNDTTSLDLDEEEGNRGWGWGNRGHNNNGNRHNNGGWRPSNNWNSQRQPSNHHFQNVNYNHRPNVILIKDHPTSNPSSSSVDSSETSCLIPSMGDAKKFELRCILVDSDRDEECPKLGKLLPSGTTIMLKCRHPYVSVNNETRLWVCENGIWKGEFKSVQCTYSRNQVDNNWGNWNGNRPKPNQWIHNNFEQPKTEEVQKSRPSNEDTSKLWDSLFAEIDKDDKDEDDKVDSNIPATTSDTWSNWERPKTTEAPQTYPAWSTSTTTTTSKPYNDLWWTAWTSTTPTTTTTTPTTTTTTTTTTQKPATFDLSNLNGDGVKCPPLSKRPGVLLQCLSKMPLPWAPSSFIVTEDECENPQPKGTEATYQCQQYYEANGALKTLYRKCKDDGTWSGGGDIFSCALECGVANPVGQIPLITSGEPTYKAQWPWHSALFIRDSNGPDPSPKYSCGATLINRKTAITAAHCVVFDRSGTVRDVSAFRIDVGRYERNVDDEYVQTFDAEAVIIHPDYNPLSHDSDIAIIILRGSVSVGWHARPICYPQTQNTAIEEVHLTSGSIGTVVGFGKNENNEEATTLHMARLQILSTKECALSFAGSKFGSTLAKSTTFCAGLNNGTNVCSGDSGGGMYFPTVDTVTGSTKWYLLGLVSVGVQTQDGSRRCDPTRSSVFTKISPYADWIRRVLSERDVALYT